MGTNSSNSSDLESKLFANSAWKDCAGLFTIVSTTTISGDFDAPLTEIIDPDLLCSLSLELSLSLEDPELSLSLLGDLETGLAISSRDGPNDVRL